MSTSIIKYLKNYSPVLMGTFILSLIGFYNGYPLVYSDTGAYIMSGFANEFLIDRPIFYGYFIRFFSFKTSLWFVIIVQNLLTAFVLYELFRYVCIKHIKVKYLTTLVILTFCSGIAWYSNQIMPDFFTPLLIISLFLLIFNVNLSRKKTIIFSILIVFYALTHYSHLLIGPLLVFSLLIIRIINKHKSNYKKIALKRYILPLMLSCSPWIIIPVTNYSYGNGFVVSGASHVFLMANINEKGILKPFLDENCEKKPYKDCKLCEQKDILPKDVASFICSDKILKNQDEWLASKEDYNKIINGTFSNGKYLLDHLYISVFYGFSQLMQNRIGEGLGSYQESTLYWRFEHEYNSYHNSRQNIWNVGVINFDTINMLQRLLLIVSFLFFVISFFSQLYQKLTFTNTVFIIAIISGIIINAFITANLSAVYSRLQARVIWLFPLAIIILFLNHYQEIKDFLGKKD